MKISIGIRTIKTAAGVSISVILAQLLQLSYYASAGILTVLSIQRTRKQSIRTVTDRFFACIVGLVIAGVCFWLNDFHVWILPVIFLIMIPVCVMFKIQGGLPSSSVIVMHTYIHQHIDMAFILNELYLVIIGLGVGLLLNLYMPSIDKQIQTYKQQIEGLIADILAHYAKHLREGDPDWDGKELLQLEDTLKAARELAELDVENHLTRKEHYYYDYFGKKTDQFHILQRMLPLVSMIELRLDQGERIGELMHDLSEDIRHREDTSDYMRRLLDIRAYHKSSPLPVTRAEFESRACLFNLANELALLIEKIQEEQDLRATRRKSHAR